MCCDFSAMRVIGMLMVHFCVLPFAVSVCCWVFYSWSKQDDKGRTKQQVGMHFTYVTLNHHHHNRFTAPFFRDHPGEPVPEENFGTLWCKRRLPEANTLTIQLGATSSGLTSAQLHHPPSHFLQAGCRPNNSVEALKATLKH